MPYDLRTLRGRALALLARELEQLRVEGKACWRCPRLLGPGGVCEEHGHTDPPRLRAGGRSAGEGKEGGATHGAPT